jgi:hypothetical protein
MHNFLKKLLHRKEPVTFSIAFGAVPAWLTGREKTAHAALTSDTAVPVQNIRNATAQLQHIVNGIAGAEHDPKIHPKLKSIAKNSLPLFVKAMNAALAKELPDDIEEFYVAAVECVKGCLNITRGQGRYLQVVFPEEMKTVKSRIDAMGHEINGITASLTTYRKEKTLIDAVQALHDAIGDITVDSVKAAGKDQRIAARIVEITDRIAEIEKELTNLLSDERMKEVNEQKSALGEIERKRDAVLRSYAALSMTASHVFRKAEKIAAKQRHPAEISILRHSMVLLSDHTLPDTKELTTGLAAACPVAERMIAAGEILLKNKEERAIFSDTDKFCADMCTSCRDIGTHEEAYRIAQEALSSHPILVRLNSLEREKAQLESMLEKETTARRELAEWKVKTTEKIPGLKTQLVKKIEEMVMENVQLQDDDQVPV